MEAASYVDVVVYGGMRAGCADGCAAPRCSRSLGEIACVWADDDVFDVRPRWVEVSVAEVGVSLDWAVVVRLRPGFGSRGGRVRSYVDWIV